jgi:hypothetical protein
VFLVLLLAVVLPVRAQSTYPVITPGNAAQIEEIDVLVRAPEGVLAAAIAPDWSFAVVALASQDIQIWDLASGEQRTTIMDQNGAIMSLTISADSTKFAATGSGSTITIWDTNGTEIQSMALPAGERGAAVAFSPDGTQITSVGLTISPIQIWDVSSGQVIRTLDDSTIGTGSLRFSPDGLSLVGGHPNLGARVWDTTSGQMILALPPTYAAMQWAAFSPDGSQIAAGCAEPFGSLCVWSFPSSERQTQTEGDLFVDTRDLVFNPAGTLILGGGNGMPTTVIDAQTGAVLSTLDIDAGIRALSWSPDGTRLATLQSDGLLRLWAAVGVVVPTTTTSLTLHEGGRAFVHVTNNDKLNVRSEPVMSTNILERLDQDAVVTMLEGPREIDGMRWWRVRTAQGIEGWAVESADGIETLIPLPD